MTTSATATLAIGLVAAATCLLSAPAQADGDSTIAFWDMSERPGSTVLVDQSGHGVNGDIASGIKLGNVDSGTGATFFKWPFAPPNTTPPTSPRLIRISDDRTNPGTADFTVAMRYRTTQNFGNVMQKGQNGNKGGYWKIEIPNGHVTCLFKGQSGSVLVNSSIILNDGMWHTIVCSRTPSGATMVIDGTTTRKKAGFAGNISNKVPMTIGGKTNCDQVTVTCDFFTGDIDWVKLSSP